MNHSKVVLTDNILSKCTGGSSTLIGLLDFFPINILTDSMVNQVNVIGNNDAVATGDYSKAISVNIENVSGNDAPMWANIGAMSLVFMGLAF